MISAGTPRMIVMCGRSHSGECLLLFAVHSVDLQFRNDVRLCTPFSQPFSISWWTTNAHQLIDLRGGMCAAKFVSFRSRSPFNGIKTCNRTPIRSFKKNAGKNVRQLIWPITFVKVPIKLQPMIIKSGAANLFNSTSNVHRFGVLLCAGISPHHAIRENVSGLSYKNQRKRMNSTEKTHTRLDFIQIELRLMWKRPLSRCGSSASYFHGSLDFWCRWNKQPLQSHCKRFLWWKWYARFYAQRMKSLNYVTEVANDSEYHLLVYCVFKCAPQNVAIL